MLESNRTLASSCIYHVLLASHNLTDDYFWGFGIDNGKSRPPRFSQEALRQMKIARSEGRPPRLSNESFQENRIDKSESRPLIQSNKAFWENEIVKSKSRPLMQSDEVFLDYACARWHFHLKESDAKPNDPLCLSASVLCDPGSRAFGTWTRVSRAIFGAPPNMSVKLIGERLGLENTSLTTAAAFGLKSLTSQLLQDVRHTTVENCGAALIVTTFGGNLDIAKILIEKGEECFQTADKDGKTPLDHAVWWGKGELVQLFIDSGAPFDLACSADNRMPLHRAIRARRKDIAKTLLRHGAAVDAVDSTGLTALMMMKSDDPSTEIEMLDILLEAKANLEHRDHSGRIPLAWYLECFERPVIHIVQGLL